MHSISSTNKLYQDFIGIEEGAHRMLVRFYEAKAEEIARLDFDTYFEILVDYTNALFEIGAYTKHIEQVEKILQLSIEHNIHFYKGEDIFCKSLFQKAAAHYNMLEFDRAEYVLKELIKITPTNELAIRFLKKCLYQSRPAYIKYARAISIACFLGAALVTAIDLIFIHPFATNDTHFWEYLRLDICGFGILLLGGSFLYHRLRVNFQINHFVQKVKAKS